MQMIDRDAILELQKEEWNVLCTLTEDELIERNVELPFSLFNRIPSIMIEKKKYYKKKFKLKIKKNEENSCHYNSRIINRNTLGTESGKDELPGNRQRCK